LFLAIDFRGQTTEFLPSKFDIRYSIFCGSLFLCLEPYTLYRAPNACPYIPHPATSNPQLATKYQKTDITTSNHPIQRAMPYALCPMPRNTYHSFSPSQLPSFPASHLPSFLA